jgi:hypothetical protein
MGLAVSLAIPTTAMGFPSASWNAPNWSMTVVETPPSVSAGNTAGFRVNITNNGTTDLNHVFLTNGLLKRPPTAFVDGPGCKPAGKPLFCWFGTLSKGETVSVMAVFATRASASAFSIDFVAVTSGGHHVRGDVLKERGVTQLVTDTQDFYGAWAIVQAAVGTSQALGAGNPQTTLVKLPEGELPVTVEDGPGVTGDCPFDSDVSATHHGSPSDTGCFGEISELHLDQGAVFPNGFAVVIRWDSSLNPPPASTIDIWHEFDAPKPGGIIGEDITNNCQFEYGSSFPKHVPCLQRSSLGGGDKQVIVWLTENGKTFGH